MHKLAVHLFETAHFIHIFLCVWHGWQRIWRGGWTCRCLPPHTLRVAHFGLFQHCHFLPLCDHSHGVICLKKSIHPFLAHWTNELIHLQLMPQCHFWQNSSADMLEHHPETGLCWKWCQDFGTMPPTVPYGNLTIAKQERQKSSVSLTRLPSISRNLLGINILQS